MARASDSNPEPAPAPGLTLLLALAWSLAAVGANQLAGHASPYLAMHGQDPVYWQDWGPEVLRRAQAENRLILISSGYFACHWCHVMQRESYQNAAVAALLNRHFIAVKLDRELHPALDAHLIDFVERTRGQAGWPLNVFLTPDGYPLVGLTYAPRDEFLSLLQRLVAAWSEDAERLTDLARRGSEQRRAEQAAVYPGPLDRRVLRQSLISAALALGDEMEGGFGRQSRFPMAPQLRVLLAQLEAEDDPDLRPFLQLTLDQMAKQGLRDQLAGGFFRYTVDPSWQVPHYEKMLYTQALLGQVYLQAAQVLERPDYRAVARDTLDFVLRELKGADGGYIASLSAVDAQGVEGGCYLWEESRLVELLTPEELAAARLRWRLHGVPPTDGGYLPVLDLSLPALAEQLKIPPERAQKRLASARAKLLAARARCDLPRDTKVLAAWNGLLLSALADAAAAFDEPRYREAGDALAVFLVRRLWDGRRLARSPDGEGSAAVEDYAYLAQALWNWGRYRTRDKDSALAVRLAAQAWERFYGDAGWRGSDELGLPGQAEQPALADGPLPSPSALLIALGSEMAAAGSPPVSAERLESARQLAQGPVRREPFWQAGSSGLLLSSAPRPAPAQVR